MKPQLLLDALRVLGLTGFLLALVAVVSLWVLVGGAVVVAP